MADCVWAHGKWVYTKCGFGGWQCSQPYSFIYGFHRSPEYPKIHQSCRHDTHSLQSQYLVVSMVQFPPETRLSFALSVSRGRDRSDPASRAPSEVPSRAPSRQASTEAREIRKHKQPARALARP